MIVAIAAFFAGVVGAVVTMFAAGSMGLLKQGIVFVPLLLISFFAPAIGVAFVLGRRFSPDPPDFTAELLKRKVPPKETTVSAEEETDKAPSSEASRYFDALRGLLAQEPTIERSGQIAVLMLLLFVAIGLTESSVKSVAILAGVILVHEGGHALGMLAFGYRDVQVFFLPFIGAVTTGRKTDAPAWQHAVVLLLGPVPGVVLGVVLLAVSQGHGITGEVGRMAVLINVFNLLPIKPLDGGRMLSVTLFSRWSWLEAAFDGLGTIVLLALGIKFGDWWLAVMGGVMLLTLSRRLRLSAAAKRIAAKGLSVAPRVEQMPLETLTVIDREARVVSPSTVNDIKAHAGVIRELYQRARSTPPGALATLALLAAYAGGVLVSFVALVVMGLTSPR